MAAYSGAFRRNDGADKLQPETHPAPPKNEPPRPQDKLGGAVSALMRKLESIEMETDDLILALILYLMYRESGDKDLLIMLGAMFLS